MRHRITSSSRNTYLEYTFCQIMYNERTYKEKQDLVFSVKLHLALSPIPLAVSLIPDLGEGYFSLLLLSSFMMLLLLSKTKVLGLSLEFDNNLGVSLGCRGYVQRLPGRCARVAGEMCKGAKVKSTPSPRPGV